MLFADVIGQAPLKARMIQSIRTGRIAHAQLFSGKLGYGGLPLALAYVQYLSCKNPSEFDACGTCPSCVKHAKLEHPDLHFAFPVVKPTGSTSKAISSAYLKEWRGFVQAQPYGTLNDWYDVIQVENKQGAINVDESREIMQVLSLKTFESEFKTLILWMPELLNPPAANKLLKIIEEPPQKTLFLFVSETPDRVLTTITSRTQQTALPPLTDADLRSGLIARGTPESSADAIAALAEGDWNKALFSLEHAAEGEANAQLFIHWMRQAFTANGAELVKASDQLAGLGREGLKHFLEYSTAVLRDAFLIGYKLPELTRVGISKEVFDLSKFATFIHGENIYDLMQLFAKAQRDISRNGNAKIVMMDLSIQITRALHRKRTAFKELES